MPLMWLATPSASPAAGSCGIDDDEDFGTPHENNNDCDPAGDKLFLTI